MFTDGTLDEARQKAMDLQLTEIKADAKNTMEKYLAGILEPAERSRNPYNPVDRALKNINTEIKEMV
jgi:hypothetical protein